MATTKKKRFTDKQERQAEHIAESEKKQGRSGKNSKRIAYSTVNKQKNAESSERTKSARSSLH